jgi:hypothetical protein
MFMMVGMCAVASADITLTFEEFKGFDRTPIGTFYSGVKFTSGLSGQDWISADISTPGNYDASSYPSGNGGGEFWVDGNVGAWTGSFGSDGMIAFDKQDATFVEIDYCSVNDFYLEAYDAGGGLLNWATGPANLRNVNNNPNGPGTLHVSWNGIDPIAYVILHDQGDGWVADNIKTDASGIIITPPTAVPAPGAILLAGMGTGIVSWLRNRRTL